MGDHREISVSVDVYAAIWRNHRPGEVTENEILERLLLAHSPMTTGTGRSSGQKRKWIDDVVEGFNRIGGEGPYNEIYDAVLKVRKEGGHRIPRSFEAIVRREVENHSSDSDAFKEGDDLFFAPRGKGAGYWALR